jgi:hypothetical protein
MLSKVETSWKFSYGLLHFCTCKSSKNQGQALASAEEQKSTREFSNGLDF